MLVKRIFNVWKNYITSQFLVTMFVFLMNWIAGGLTGLHFAFLNALAAGVCEVVPSFGSFISWGITALLALIFGSSNLNIANWQYALIIVGCSILIQCLEECLVSPLILGKKLDLHPLLVTFGMLLFSALFGFWGMILAVPVMASLKEVKLYSTEIIRRPGKQRYALPAKDKLQYVLPAKDMLQ